ncbi:MAG: FAD-dependent oxidoreductase, partial [Vicinamibacterales bacterium]
MKADRRSRFMPFGVFSDERYHLVDGNDGIASGLAARLSRPVELGLKLTRVRRIPDGRIELVFKQGSQTVTRRHQFAVLTLPFSVLRGVELDAGLQLPAWKRTAINQLGYGTNA